MRIVFYTIIFLVACTHAVAFEEKQVVKLSERVNLIAEMHEFVKNEHELFFCDQQRLCLVDGYPVFGTEGAVPKVELKNLILVVDNKPISLDHRGMFNPWSPIEGKSLHVQIIEDSPNGLRIRGEFSDGAAAYIVEWLVLGEGSARVLIDCIECVAAAYSRTIGK